VAPTSRNITSWAVFACGLLVFLYIRGGLAAKAYPASLNFPLWDTYFYISKAAQLQECFWQNCPALKDLKVQFTPVSKNGDYKSRHNKTRVSLVRGELPPIPQYLRKFWAYHCILHVYHPLHSLAVVALAKLSNTSLEAAYRHFTLFFGMIFLAFAVAFFLLTATDTLSAGIALVLLSYATFNYQGVRNITPAALSLAFGLLMFACLLRARGKPGIIFFLLSLLSMGFHKIGFVLTGLAVIYGVLCQYPEPLSKSLKRFIPTLIIIFFFFVLINTVEQPAFRTAPQVVPPDAHYLPKVIDQLKYITKMLLRWLRKQGTLPWPKHWHQAVKEHWLIFAFVQLSGIVLYLWVRKFYRVWPKNVGRFVAVLILLPSLLTLGTGLALAVILYLGIVSIDHEKRRMIWLLLGVLTTGLFLGCFFVQYGFHAQLSTRLFVVWQVAATAIFARGLVVAVKAKGLGDFTWSKYLVHYLPQRISSQLSWRLFLAGFLVIGMTPRIIESYKFLRDKGIWAESNQHFSLDQEQPLILIRNTKPDDFVLYDDEMVLAHFLTHGALQRRAIFLPTLPLPPGMVANPAHVKAMVSRNPYLWLNPGYPEGYRAGYPLRLPPGAKLEILLKDDVRVEYLEILSPSPPLPDEAVGSFLTIERRLAEKVYQEEVILSHDKWKIYPLRPILSGGVISFRNLNKVKSIFIGGLRLGPITPSNQLWPWQGVKRVIWLDPKSRKPYCFTPSLTYFFNGEYYRLKPLHDGGTNVLWKMTRESLVK